MRDSFNCCLPVVQDEMNAISLRSDSSDFMAQISSNGYYGYQPVAKKQPQEQNVENMEVQICDNNGDIQFNNLIEIEDDRFNNQREVDMRGSSNRKRRWGYEDEMSEFKKPRQQQEPNIPFMPELSAQTRSVNVNLRQPTHNIPDFPRCLMGHFI